MGKTITAVYDGEVLRPEAPLDLKTDERYEITIGPPVNPQPPQSAWDILEALDGKVDMPEDWSAETDHYLRGTPKRHEEGG